jgi:DNA-binding XRE family transcriptional regulator
MDSAAAAHEVGVDPVVAQLWLRLPDDLWPDAAASGPGSRAASAVGAAPHPPSEEQGPRPTDPRPPTPGLRRVLTCRIPFPAFDRLRAAGQPGGPLEAAPLLEAAVAALETGLKLERPPVAPGGWHFPRRPLAVPLPGEAYAAIVTLAQEAFAGDLRDAAGWVIARGVGMALPLPTPEELAGVAKPREPVLSERPFLASSAASPNARFFIPPRRRPEPRAPLPPDDSAPSGDELRRRREAIGVSQRDLAAASGLSRGLVAEVERGRRRHVLTRLRLAETLASLALRQ